MSSVDFDRLRQFTDIPTVAEQLLSRPEREISFNLTLKTGPGHVLQASSYLCLFNTARGVAKGGIRIASDVTLEEVRDLGERMVWKTALARLPFGGGKSGIRIDPKMLSRFEKTAVVKEYVHMISLELRHGMYVPAPDMGTDQTDMAVIFGELHIPECVTGKPPRVGGLPGRLEATGRGVCHTALLVLREIVKKRPEEATAAVQGFGNVGSYAALFLHRAGVRVVAVSDVDGGLYDPAGLDVPSIFAGSCQSGTLPDAPVRSISNAELLALDVDLLCPCAKEDQITRENAGDVRALAVVEGANGPTTPEADVVLDGSRTPVVPDILANAGGVTASYVEWRQGKSGAITDRSETFKVIEDRLDLAFAEVLRVQREKACSLRTACEVVAAQELVQAMRDRDWI